MAAGTGRRYPRPDGQRRPARSREDRDQRDAW